MKLPEEFLKRMKERLGEEFPAFLQSYDRAPYKGLRVNTLKAEREKFLDVAPFPLGEQINWEPLGFYIEEEKAGAYIEHFAGLYYLQEPSAMAVGELTAPCKKYRVLDLCAAPGGKTVQVAMQMEGDGILISNEIDFGRAKILSQNVERMGIKNCAVTSAAPRRLAECFPEYFDLIIVDAPCSGEGMFLKEPEAIPHWSPANVSLCAARQKDILEEAAKMLAVDGSIVYSTCTFSEEEDEWQIRDFLKRHPEFEFDEEYDEYKLYPHEFKGEGHYCARLYKKEGSERRAKPYPVKRNTQANKAFEAFAKDFFVEMPKGEITTLLGGRMYLVPEGMPAVAVSMLRLGVELGEFDGKNFKPAHALAMSVKRSEVKRFVPLSRDLAEKYLHGETLDCGLDNGWCVAGFGDYPLGLGKVVNGVMKNHLPKGLRKIT
ncbi:MAG: RsmF rRNA methyltransferase first C-terminal domain-containing protein [Clostridiales bacterium]|nr:RsmF rRNA methyltransferase first C-terminal domain-containing protein [Clostridiales bacterium]